MTFALVAVVGVIVVAGSARAVWRRVVDESRSVGDYHQVLDTLRRVETRSVAPRVTPAPTEAGPRSEAFPGPEAGPRSQTGHGSEAGARLGAGGVPAAGASSWPSGRPVVTEADPTLLGSSGSAAPAAAGTGPCPGDAGPRRSRAGARSWDDPEATRPVPTPVLRFDDLAAPTPAAPGPGAVEDRSPIAATRRRPLAPLRVATIAAAVLVVAAVGAMVAVGHRTAGREAASAAPSGGVHRTSGRADGSTARRDRSTNAPHGAARPPVVVPTAATRYQGTVTVPAAAYQVVVQVSAPCWVQGTETATGTDVWSGVLQAGQQHTFRFEGAVLLEIGAADATLTIDGTPVALPSGYQVPYDLHLEPAA